MLEMIAWNPINLPGLVSMAVVHFRCVLGSMVKIANAIEKPILINRCKVYRNRGYTPYRSAVSRLHAHFVAKPSFGSTAQSLTPGFDS